MCDATYRARVMRIQKFFAGVVLAALLSSGCSAVAGGTLGGRDRCWNSSDKRIASLMKGTLRLAVDQPRLDTPEGERLALYFAGVKPSAGTPGALVDSAGTPVAHDGELVTLFGGLGADESMVVCSVEARA
jgi:hypothetical protein